MKRIILATWLAACSLLAFYAFTAKTGKTAAPAPPLACETLTGVERIVCLANDFKSSLSSSQQNTMQLDYTFDNATTWSNFPVSFVQRLGIRFDALSDDQLTKAKALIEAALGTDAEEGYSEMVELWEADQYLAENGGGNQYGEELYYVAFLGEPSTTGAWELQTGGHHVAVANTYAGGAMTGATPSFRAVEPFSAFTLDGSTYQPMIEEREALAAMFDGLSTTQLNTAKLSGNFGDILLGPNKDWQFPANKSGLKCSELTADQKSKVIAAIATYVNDISDAEAAEYMALYTSQIDDTYIAYANNYALTAQNQYVRIDGPRVWIEFSMQGGIVLSGPHPHSVWRDHHSDYGGLGNPNPSATQSVAQFTGKFELGPNPADSFAQVIIGLEKAATVSVSLFDQNGKKLYVGFKYNVTAGEHTMPLDVRRLPQGIYNCVLEVKNADGKVAAATRKLTKI